MYSNEQLDFKIKQQPPNTDQAKAELISSENSDFKPETSEDLTPARLYPDQMPSSLLNKEGLLKIKIDPDDAPEEKPKQENYYNTSETPIEQKATLDLQDKRQSEAQTPNEQQVPEKNSIKANNFFLPQPEPQTDSAEDSLQQAHQQIVQQRANLSSEAVAKLASVNQRLEYYHSDESDEAIFENQQIAQRKKQLQEEIEQLEKRAIHIQQKRQQSYQSRNQNQETIVVPDFVQNPQINSRNNVSKDSTSFEYFDKDDLTDNPMQSQDNLFSPQKTHSKEEFTSPDFKTNINMHRQSQREASKDISFLNNFDESHDNFLSREAFEPILTHHNETTGNLKEALAKDNQIVIKKSAAVRHSLNAKSGKPGSKLSKIEPQKDKTPSEKLNKADARSSGQNKATKLNKLSILSSKLELEKLDQTQDAKKKALLSKSIIEEEEPLFIPDEPPIPLSYIKYHNKRGGALGGKLMNVQEEEDGQKVYFEPLSYSKLERRICQLHPVDPETKQRFDYKDRVTVDNYYGKITDMCCFYQITQAYKILMKYIRKQMKIKEPTTLKKPKSLQDDLSSDSSSSSSDDECGITQCSQSLGDGASLYLQMMKTLTIMFFLLALINIPIFIMYESNTTGNKLNNYNEVFKYFTIGNLGQMSKKCGFSDFEHRFSVEAEIPQENIKFDCGLGYIGEIQEFGFLYKFDKEWGGDTEGQAVCNSIIDPFFEYRKPEPEPIVCNVEEFEDELDPEFLRCEINRREQVGELSEEEANQAREDLEAEAGKRLLQDQDETQTDTDSIDEDQTSEDLQATTDNLELTDSSPSDDTASSVQDSSTDKTPESDQDAILDDSQDTDTQLDAVTDAQELTEEERQALEKRQELIWVYEDEIDEVQEVSPEMTKYNLDEECVFKGKITSKKAQTIFKDKKAQEKFLKYFNEECKYKQACELDPNKIGYEEGEIVEGEAITKQNAGLFGLISDDCKLRMSNEFYLNITSKIYLAVIGCQSDFVVFPIVNKELHKEVCGIVIVCFDIASILVMIYFFTKINTINNDFLDEMDNLQVQMKDFGVVIKDVRLDKFTYDSRVIKIKVWKYFKKILEPIAKENPLNDMECIDVCLSLYTQPSIQCVFRMQEIQLQINDINDKLMTNQYGQDEIPDRQDELKVLIDKQKRFVLRYKQLTAKRVHNKEDDGEYNLQVPRVPKSQKINKVQYVFVIFKNCTTREDVLELFPKESAIAQKIKEAFGMKTLKKEDKKLFNRTLQIDGILEPDEIIWQNLQYTVEEQQARKLAVDIFSVFFVLANTLFTMYLSYFKIFMNKRIPDPLGCPDQEITTEEAYQDIKHKYDDYGLWMCYCDQATSIFMPWTLRNKFTVFQQGTDDSTNYCWRFQYLQVIKKVSLFFVSTSAVFINEYVADLYQELGKFQKKHTKNEEQQTCFRQIFIQEFINMGIIVLISSFDRIGMKAILFPDQAEGIVYQGFEPQWYMDYGKNICIFIFMSSFVVNSKDMGRWFVTVVFRCIDRKGKLNLKLDPEDEDCDKPNTKIRIQKYLEALYTGKVFKGEKAYSRLMSTMFVIQMYSSGMPILYLNGFIFYLVTFCCNKLLLIYYYQKSRTLSRTIPLFTMQYLKFGLLLHMLAACLMLTNKLGFVTRAPSGLKKIFNVDDAKEQLGDVQNIAKAEERVEFLHQQMYFLFLIFFTFTYFIGKSFLVFAGLIIQGLMRVTEKGFKKFVKYTKEKAAEQLLHEHKVGVEKNRITQLFEKHFKGVVTKKKQESVPDDEEDDIVIEPDHECNDYDMRDLKTGQIDDYKVKKHIKQYQESNQKELQNQNENQKENQPNNQQEESKSNLLQAVKSNQDYSSQRPGSSVPLKDEDGNTIDTDERKRIDEENKRQRDIKKEQRKLRLSRKDYSDNIYKEFNTENLSNFYDRCQRELTDFWDLFQHNKEITWDDLRDDNKDPFSVLFLETLYTYRITKDECITYQKFLLDRLKDVEDIIDSHFELIIPFLHKKLVHSFEADRNRRKKDNKEGTLKDQMAQKRYEEWFFKYSDEIQFENKQIYTHKKRMKLLVEFQDELILGDKDRKDNKKGEQEICRMRGSLSQSYFIFDAQQYKVGRKIYYGIENGPAEEQSEQEKKEELQDQEPSPSEEESDSGSGSYSGSSSEVSEPTERKSKKPTPEKTFKKSTKVAPNIKI